MPKIGFLSKRPTAFIGIDPGKNGGVTVLTDSFVMLYKMPLTERDKWDLLVSKKDSAVAVIEWIHPAIQGIGKSEMSKLYGNYMQLRGFLIAAGIPFEDVKTAAWARAVGIPARLKTESRSQWKGRLRGVAQQLYPNEKVILQTADALLIATYCQRKHEGKL